MTTLPVYVEFRDAQGFVHAYLRGHDATRDAVLLGSISKQVIADAASFKLWRQTLQTIVERDLLRWFIVVNAPPCELQWIEFGYGITVAEA